jgi:bifunctional non-homologous end joining protein LigD
MLATPVKEPDYIVIDLDPSDDDFKKAIEAAKAARQFFDEQKPKAVVKTSGKTGIHAVLPCRGFTFKQARRIAENICREVHLLIPGITTTEVSIAKRGTNLYLDPNQNDEADTIALLNNLLRNPNRYVDSGRLFAHRNHSIKVS